MKHGFCLRGKFHCSYVSNNLSISTYVCTHGCIIPYSGKVWRAECLANLLFLSIWRKKVWRMNGSANRLSMVGINLDGFSLANRLRFAKFAKLSPRQTFPLYGTFVTQEAFHKTSGNLYLNQKHHGCKKSCGQELKNGHVEKDVKSKMGGQWQCSDSADGIKF